MDRAFPRYALKAIDPKLASRKFGPPVDGVLPRGFESEKRGYTSRLLASLLAGASTIMVMRTIVAMRAIMVMLVIMVMRIIVAMRTNVVKQANIGVLPMMMMRKDGHGPRQQAHANQHEGYHSSTHHPMVYSHKDREE